MTGLETASQAALLGLQSSGPCSKPANHTETLWDVLFWGMEDRRSIVRLGKQQSVLCDGMANVSVTN